MVSNEEFPRRLKIALSHYSYTLDLLDNLLDQRRSPQEIILLACSRLDSLSNLAYPTKGAQESAFRRFLTTHSGDRKLFNSVSIGDLYWSLLHDADFAYVMIDKPGRIQRLGADSERYIAFIEESGVPVTGDAVYKLSIRVCSILKRNFRVRPRQRLGKPYLASTFQVKEALKRGLPASDRTNVLRAIAPLLDHFKCSSILYRRYRNKAIHGLRVSLDEGEFFSYTRPYSGLFHSSEHGPHFMIEFPGRYLRDLLESTLQTLRMHLLAKQKLPLDLFNAMFSFQEVLQGDVIRYLADEELSGWDEVKWQLRTR